MNGTVGNSTTEPYNVVHNLLLAHSAVARLYRRVYQEEQKGSIGIALWFKWYEPLDTSNDRDIAAAHHDFYFGWFMDPLTSGEYPASMRRMLGPRLPRLTPEEAAELCDSLDFLGLNAITAAYARDNSDDAHQSIDNGYFGDSRVSFTEYGLDGTAIGPEGADDNFTVPWCLAKIVAYVREQYNNLPMYITTEWIYYMQVIVTEWILITTVGFNLNVRMGNLIHSRFTRESK